MKRGVILNSDIVSALSRMGHGDSLCIGDAGLPIPGRVPRIDLALRAGVPGFAETLSTVLEELCIERAVLAKEIRAKNPDQFRAFQETIGAYEAKYGKKVQIDFEPHEHFKKTTESCAAIVRTGECTPYSNVILYSGVIF